MKPNPMPETFTDSFLKRFWSYVRPTKEGCWEWIGSIHKTGYGTVAYGRGSLAAHRVIYQLTFGKIPEGLFILHGCDNKKCVNPSHLRAGTNAENIKEAAIKDQMHVKLSSCAVREIRRLYIEGFSQPKIANMFGCCQSSISKIVSRKRRMHVN